jgi:hypothetical protein
MKYRKYRRPATQTQCTGPHAEAKKFCRRLVRRGPDNRATLLRYRRMLAVAAWNTCYVTDPIVIANLLANRRLPDRFEHLREDIEVDGGPPVWTSNIKSKRPAPQPWTAETIRQDIRNARMWFGDFCGVSGLELGDADDLSHYDSIPVLESIPDADEEFHGAMVELSDVLKQTADTPEARRRAAKVLRRARKDIVEVGASSGLDLAVPEKRRN